jgi:hypothetical protein
VKNKHECPCEGCNRVFEKPVSVRTHLQYCDYHSGDVGYPTDEMLISDLKQVYAKLDRSPKQREYDKLGKYTSKTLINRFETFNNAKIKADIPLGEKKNISKNKLISDLKRVSELINTSPNYDDYNKYGRFNASTLEENFGSFNNSKKQANLSITVHDKGNEWSWNGSSEENKWKNDVFERDDYICQDCGDDTGGNLNAHHIKRRNQHPELRDCVENGITLCKTCHTERHSNENFYEMLKSNSDKDYSKMLSERRERLEKLEEPYFVKNRENVPFIREPKNEPNV